MLETPETAELSARQPLSESVMSDRQLLIHTLEHVEAMHAKLAELLERYGPLLEQAAQRRRRWDMLSGGRGGGTLFL